MTCRRLQEALWGRRSPAGGQHWACTSAIFVASSVTPRLVRAMSGRSAASATVWPAEPLPGADQAFWWEEAVGGSVRGQVSIIRMTYGVIPAVRTGEILMGTPVCCASIIFRRRGRSLRVGFRRAPEQEVTAFSLRGRYLAASVVLVAGPSRQQYSDAGEGESCQS